MPLTTLLALVTFGIALVMLVTHALGGSSTPVLDADRARAVLTAEHPEARASSVRLDVAGRVALVTLVDGRLGVVTMLGDHAAVRVVPPENAVWHDDDHVRVRFGDVGWPARDLHLTPGRE